MGNVLASFSGFDDFLAYFAVALVLLACFVAIYMRVTPYRELHLIREGNMAASFAISGALLGFIVPLCSAIKYSVGLVDMVIWGVIALVVQVAAYVCAKLMVPTIPDDIIAGKQAQGFFLGALSIGVGLINAACMTY